MKTQQAHSTHSVGRFAGLASLLLVAIGGAGWWTWRTLAWTSVRQSAAPERVKQVPTLHPETSQTHAPQVAPTPSAIAPTEATGPRASLAKPQQQALQPTIYWLKIEGQAIHLLPKPVALDDAVTPEQALTEGLIHLLAQPHTQLDTAIPTGTRLLSLRVTPSGVYVDLSREFGQGGGSTSMIYRVAQILYTATSLDPNAKVYLSVEGQALDEDHPLGGEGLLLKHPLTRQQFTEDFPIS